ncbi:MAG: DUF3419 family protein [Balneolaceae bacterium]|nr:MAG: DUF3419 family protein [Balneolaceae bacterium]
MSEQQLTSEKSFQQLLYAQCWEDPLLNQRGLALQGGETVAAICSAGDNVFAHLLDDPETVYAVDLNPSQIAAARLKMQAFMNLDWEQVVAFLGLEESHDRMETYRLLMGDLPDEDRTYWNAHQNLIGRGIIHCGKFEGYFHKFQKFVLPFTHSKKVRLQLFEPKSALERARFYDSKWDNFRWRMLFRLFFNQRVMSRFGRSKAHFAHVGDGDITRQFLSRSRMAMVELDPSQNCFMQYMIHARYLNRQSYPEYLKREHFDTIRSRLDRVRFISASLGGFLSTCDSGTVDAWNLSDIFEYLDEETFRNISDEIHRVSRNGARCSYWNLLVRRRMSDISPGKFRHHKETSHDLWMQDRAFVYGDYILENVQK